MATGIYLRVSSSSQTVASQRREIERYLTAHRIGDVTWFIDNGTTGTTMNRPALRKLKASIFAGEIDTVIVYALDRLARNALEGLNLLADWLKRGVRMVVLTLQMDLSGDVGQMIASLLFHIAQMERSRLRDRQAAGIAAAKANGLRWGGRRPGVGCKANPDRVLELRARGLSNREVAKALGCSVRTVQRHAR